MCLHLYIWKMRRKYIDAECIFISQNKTKYLKICYLCNFTSVLFSYFVSFFVFWKESFRK